MDDRARTAADEYAEFLRGRWGARAALLARYALGGSVVFALLDWGYSRHLGGPSLARIALARLPLALLALLGWGLARWMGGSRRLPGLAVAVSLAWAWTNACAYFWLGLAGTPVQAVSVLACCLTAATFLPLTLSGHVGISAAIFLGHLALDLAWPQSRPLDARLGADLAIAAFITCEMFLFANLARAKRRGRALRADLERALVDLERARRERELELQQRVRAALEEVKVLSGLLPICAWCKKVRNDAGYWQLLEAYVSEHSKASFTHAICPGCLTERFGGAIDHEPERG